MKMSNKCYDILKTIAQVVIPALATLYWILSEYLGLVPYGETVIGILIAIDTCLGSILAYSTYEYENEEEDIETGTGVVGSLDDKEDNE